MMKTIVLFVLVCLATTSINAQDKFFTKSGTITIDATTNASLETVHAVNRTASFLIEVWIFGVDRTDAESDRSGCLVGPPAKTNGRPSLERQQTSAGLLFVMGTF